MGQISKGYCEWKILQIMSHPNENHIEDEYHVLLKCPFYGGLRKIYLCFNYDPFNLYRPTFINIMCIQSQEEIVQLACLYQACLNWDILYWRPFSIRGTPVLSFLIYADRVRTPMYETSEFSLLCDNQLVFFIWQCFLCV